MTDEMKDDFHAQVVAQMRDWLERAVIGLNLCPFAKSVHVKGQIHYVVSEARTADELLSDLKRELSALTAESDTVRDTSLLMAPHCLSDFLDFNDFLGHAEDLLHDMGLAGALQIASFHPQFQFAGVAQDDITNYTNRAPYPTLHLLRESSIDRAVEAFPEAEMIYEKNIDTLQRLGHAGWESLGLGGKPGDEIKQTTGGGNEGGE